MPGPDPVSSSLDPLRRNHREDSESKQFRHVGAIDIGTNSTHLLVAEIDPVLHTFSIKLAEKSTTRLGERDFESGELTDSAMNRVFDALKGFKELAESYKVEELLIAATSAVREAPNGEEFLQKVRSELGLDIDLISGAEEARLIYLGVLSGMPFGDNPHILIDIGGGSTELILADARDARALTSTRVGAVRLQRDFIREDPLSVKRREFLRTFIEGSLEPAVNKISSRIKENEYPTIVATSGTAMAIGSLIASEESTASVSLHGFTISEEQLDKSVEKLLSLNLDQRKKLAPLNERRAEIIVPGALILQKTIKMFSAKELILSERALREGLIFDWMLRKGLLKDQFGFQSSIRKRTIYHQANRFAVNISRAEYVADNALIIYEKTKGILHNDRGLGKELLWAAAMLHTCGQHINLSGYHKHSWYLIRHGELLGYSHSEHLMVAAIARYHRRSLPKKRHDSWQSLIKGNQRRIVYEMSILLRLAASLDRRPNPAVNTIDVIKQEDNLIFKLAAISENQNLNLERWSLLNNVELLKDNFDLSLEVLTVEK